MLKDWLVSLVAEFLLCLWSIWVFCWEFLSRNNQFGMVLVRRCNVICLVGSGSICLRVVASLWKTLVGFFVGWSLQWFQISSNKLVKDLLFDSLGSLEVWNQLVFNRALLGIWLWHYAAKRETLWISVVDIRREWGIFYRFVRFDVSDGSKFKFCHDVWFRGSDFEGSFPRVV